MPQKRSEKVSSNKPKAAKQDSGARVIGSLVGTLGGALEEDIVEIDGFLSEEPPLTADTPRDKAKRRLLFVLGVIILILTVIGTISTVRFAVDFAGDLTSQKTLREQFTRFIYPLVITDPPDFQNAVDLPSPTIISAAVWRIILTGGNENYKRDMGFMTVPAIDVETSAHTLFGNEKFTITHQTVDNIEITFEYDAAADSYIVPENPRYMTYTPEVSSFTNVGESYRLSVNYILPSPLSLVEAGYKDEPIKTMIYTVSRSSGKMTITGIELPQNATGGE